MQKLQLDGAWNSLTDINACRFQPHAGFAGQASCWPPLPRAFRPPAGDPDAELQCLFKLFGMSLLTWQVIPDVGLVVTIYDVTSIEGGHVYPNDGAAYFRSKFRLVVFRPFAGEVIVGKLLSCNK